jgi:hypothetical protein
MEKAYEKFRLPAPGSARSELLSLKNCGLKIGAFSKKIVLKVFLVVSDIITACCLHWAINRYFLDQL